jgi:oligogalacturonide transport system substrate-binding protein
MDRYPHITVVSEYGEWGGSAWRDSVFTQVVGRVEPDIMQVNYAWVHAFGLGENVFFDLRQVSDILDLTEWTPDMHVFMTTADGQLGFVPHGMTGRVMLYNRLMLEDFGRTSFPSTMEDLVAYGLEVAANNTAVDTGNNRYAFWPIGPESLDIVILQLLYNRTGRNLQENGQMMHTVAEVQEVFDIIGTLIDSNAIPSFHQQEPPHNASNPVWVEGRAGSAFEWVGNIFLTGDNFLEGGHRDDLGVALLPDAPLTMQRPSLGHAISRNTNNPELAAYLLNFLYTDREALLAIAHQLGVPASRTASALAQETGMIEGLQLFGANLIADHPAVMCEYFEDAPLRQPRFTIIEEFRLGSIDSATAAQRFISEQQSALNVLFGG